MRPFLMLEKNQERHQPRHKHPDQIRFHQSRKRREICRKRLGRRKTDVLLLGLLQQRAEIIIRHNILKIPNWHAVGDFFDLLEINWL